MKFILYILIAAFCGWLFAILTGCGSSSNLPSSFRTSEQLRIDTYMDFRAEGSEFSSDFYNQSDSIFNAMPKDNQKLISAYATIQSMRDADSCGRLLSEFYSGIRVVLHEDFNIVGRGNQ